MPRVRSQNHPEIQQIEVVGLKDGPGVLVTATCAAKALAEAQARRAETDSTPLTISKGRNGPVRQ